MPFGGVLKGVKPLLLEEEEGEDEGEEGEGFDDADGGEGFSEDGGLFECGLDACGADFALVDGGEHDAHAGGYGDGDAVFWGECAAFDGVGHEEHEDEAVDRL